MRFAIKASYRVHIHCPNCQTPSSRRFDVPDVDDAPDDIDDLVASQAFQQQRFQCGRCESPIGMVHAISPWADEASIPMMGVANA